ncbi:MAG: hypothetical protein ACYDHY_06545 [Acidiferrobacterales bacterium]
MFVIIPFLGMFVVVPLGLAVYLYAGGSFIGAGIDLFMIGPIWASYFLYLYNRRRDRIKLQQWNREVNALRHRR